MDDNQPEIEKDYMKLAALFAALIAAAIDAMSPGPTMKAIVAHQWGGPEVLKSVKICSLPAERERDSYQVFCRRGELIRWNSCRASMCKSFRTQLPWIPGYDVAGTVEKVGSNVKKFKAGDSRLCVHFSPNGGGYAEYALAKENQAALEAGDVEFC